ncbi:MAG: polysaccharide biosynthesis protein [Candidatus Paracaedimonas acanthamoebae]|uniref:Polysaccharide biosynthesis protein n=1 Tax=Candidatus Paracaedimonas acanthamoebae TaxID=244581 RepID=A0A8J7TTB4_9PROT|nr:polysaccharide biosynthesis protein [Candidatus Paracaedimonas acanthamoebae]
MSLITVPLALWILVGGDIVNYPVSFIIKHMLVFSLFSISIFLWMKTYRAMWRYVSVYEIMTIVASVTCTVLLYIPIMMMMAQTILMPHSVMILIWGLNISFLSAGRFIYRILQDYISLQDGKLSTADDKLARLLLVGISDQTGHFIQEINRYARRTYKIVGIIDNDRHHLGGQIHGVEVIGIVDNLKKIVTRLNAIGEQPHHLVITDPDFKGEPLRRIMELSKSLKVDVARAPKLADFKKSSSRNIEIEPISIEDLLQRPEVVLDHQSMHDFVHGKRIMVTGAGGTIGNELIRQIADFGPAHLTLVDHSEYSLYSLDLTLSEKYASLSWSICLGDVSDDRRISDLFKIEKPEIVFHAAALKHVPIAEMNANETILTNVIGTRNIAEACRTFKIKAMVFISTDKAVNPTGVMGATKRLAESYCQALDALNEGTKFITTRFGNVLGSTGSVVPLFQRQISYGGPITLTDPDIRRYFMLVREAVELVLQAAALGYNSTTSNGQIFILEMGGAVKIKDLAYQMILLAGLTPEKDIKINYTGLRPGEKLYEELFYETEKLMPTSCPGLMLASPQVVSYSVLQNKINELEEKARARETQKSLDLLKNLVPEYKKATHKEDKKKNIHDNS